MTEPFWMDIDAEWYWGPETWVRKENGDWVHHPPEEKAVEEGQ